MLLPKAVQNSYFEDVLLDILLLDENVKSITSLVDARLYVKSSLKKMVEITDVGIATDAYERMSLRLFSWMTTKRVPQASSIGKLLQLSKKALVIKTPLIQQAYEGGVSHLCIMVPKYDENDETTVKAVAQLVSLASVLHSTKTENIRLGLRTDLGIGKYHLSNSLNKLVDNIKSSALHSKGLFLGSLFKTSSGYQGNLVGLLASMRLLSTKQEFLRKRTFPKDSGKSVTSFNELQELFNTHAGLKTDETSTFMVQFLKAILASSVKPHNKGFPGGWIHSNRALNSVKSDFALLNLLGWTEKVPSQHKMLEVLFNEVKETSADHDGVRVRVNTVVNKTQVKENFTHQEFRTAVALSLPRLDAESSDLMDQLKLDPLSVRDLAVCNNFVEDNRVAMVDRLNEAYSFRVSEKNPKSKTKPIHYKMARDRLLASSANIPLVDAKRRRYSHFKDLPRSVQSLFRQFFRYPEKRDREEDVVEMTDVPTNDASNVQDEASTAPPPTKVLKKGTNTPRRGGRVRKT